MFSTPMRRLLAVVLVGLSVVAFGVIGSSIREHRLVSDDKQVLGEVLDASFMYMGDTYVCPSLAAIRSYLEKGLTEETNYCSPIMWASVDVSVSLGSFAAPIADAFREYGAGVPLATHVEVFRVKFQNFELFAIRDLIDIHASDWGVGLLDGVTYTVWVDQEA